MALLQKSPVIWCNSHSIADFMLSATREAEAAERFFRKPLAAYHTTASHVVTVDRNPSVPPCLRCASRGKKTSRTLSHEAMQVRK